VSVAVAIASIGIASGCGDSEHLMIAKVPAVIDVGQALVAVDSAPLIAPDRRSILYLKFMLGGVPFPVMSRDIHTGIETPLFTVPANSILWTYNYRSSTLLFSIANGAGVGRHIAEYDQQGHLVRDFSVPSGFQDYNASISADGQVLAFVRIEDSTGITSLWRRSAAITSDTGTRITQFPSGHTVLSLRWIDADCFLYTDLINASNAIQNHVQCTGSGFDAPELGSFAAPAPIDSVVAWLDGSITGPNDLYLSRLDGAAKTRLTNSQSAKDRINWSLDGLELIYVATEGQPPKYHLEMVSLPQLQ
jgi:Tol biopolymer transport system component